MKEFQVALFEMWNNIYAYIYIYIYIYINEKWTKRFKSEAIITIRKVVLKTSAISIIIVLHLALITTE